MTDIRTNIGILFDNSSSKRSDRAPDHRGDMQIDLSELFPDGQIPKCFKLELAGWNRRGRNGPFVSLKAQLPRERRPRQAESDDHPPF